MGRTYKGSSKKLLPSALRAAIRQSTGLSNLWKGGSKCCNQALLFEEGGTKCREEFTKM